MSKVLAPSAAEPSASGPAVAKLARPRLALAGLAGRPRRDAVGIGNAEFVLLQTADFVAQPCRFLELQVGGGFPHPLLKVADVGAQVVANEVRPLLVAGVDHQPLAGGKRA